MIASDALTLDGISHGFFTRRGGVRLAALAGVLIGSAPWAVLLARRVSPAALAVPLATLLLAGLISALPLSLKAAAEKGQMDTQVPQLLHMS